MSIVALVSSDEDRTLMAAICHRHQWNVHFATTCGEAAETARRLKAPVILCDRDLPGLQWRDVVQVLATSSHGACVILLSKVLDDYLRDEVGIQGGFDVLSKPLREDDVIRAIKLAWSYWNSMTASVG